MESNLVSHVLVENLSGIGANKRPHRNVIQTSQTPTPKKRENGNKPVKIGTTGYGTDMGKGFQEA